MRKISSIALLLLANVVARAGIVGEWMGYPAFGNITEVESAGNVTYVLASGGLYSYNSKDQSVITYDKAKTLNDCDISHIGWCQEAKRLVIVYSNQNIDLLETNGNTINISEYYTKSYTDDKTVNGLNISGPYAYLSTGFGIVKINVKGAYIADTYNIGIPVNWTHVDAERIYAESEKEGQWSALLKSNLLDKSNWQKSGGYKKEDKKITEEQMTIAKTYRPDGPENNNFGFMRFANGRLYTIGGYQENPARPAVTQIMENNKWTNISNDLSYMSERVFLNAYKIETDPKDPNHWYVAARTGLYEFKDNKCIKDYYCNNSPLQRAASVPETNVNYTLVTSCLLDKEYNLWVLNGIAPKPSIYKLDKQGQWTTLSHPELMCSEKYSWVQMKDAFFDSRGLMWFANNDWRNGGLAYYNTQTDKLKTYNTINNQDGTKVFFFYGRTVKEDRDGNIWFCTDVGPLMIPAHTIANDSPEFHQVKVPRLDGTGLADYLLAGIDCTCMAIDGGNRKWFGTTGNGVYVIDSDNITQLHHFIASECPILSDNIESITINDANGEVFIGTDKGLCSYTTDATNEAPELESSNIYAYPNPVTPDYTGLITITGLTYKASIKIVTASGNLVAEGTSNGGTFTWDGTDLNGNRVASGVYMVLAATESGKKGAVCKIGIVR